MTTDATPEAQQQTESENSSTSEEQQQDRSTTDTTADEQQQSDEDREPRSKEAQRYRQRLRDTEAERDQIRGQLDAQRTALVDTALAAAGLDPRLWAAANINLAELETDGVLDAGLVAERVASLVEEYGVSRPRPPKPNPQQGNSSGGQPGATWSGLLKSASQQ